jgi:hypothetical protein
MTKLSKIIGTTALVITVGLLPMFTPVSLAADANPCDGPRTEFMEGWCD